MVRTFRYLRSNLCLAKSPAVPLSGQQRPVDGRVGQPEIVVRIDNAAAQQVIPDTVGLGPGEKGIVGPRHPVGQQLEAISVVGQTVYVGSKEAGQHHFPRNRMLHLAVAGHEDELLAVELVLVELVLCGFVI